jgi:hypothetical protein
MAGIRPDRITVSDVKSRLLTIAQTSLYRLTIPVPPDVSSFASQRGITSFDVDNISLLCSEANLPGSALATHEATNDYHGVSEKMVYRRLYDETADMTFYVDRNYKVVEFFETWIDYITGVGDVFTRTQFESPYVHHRMAYANDYKVNFYLTKFERDHHVPKNQTTLDYTFVYGFPISINSMAVSYEQSQLLKCNVSFSFIRYVMKRNRSSTLTSSVQNIQTLQPNIDLYKNPNLFDNSPFFDVNKLTRTITNEYYNNGIIRGVTPGTQRQGPGQRSQDATNFSRDFA